MITSISQRYNEDRRQIANGLVLMIIHKMNRVSGFIIIGALVRISEYHIILNILIKSRYTAVQYRGTQPKYRGIPRYVIFRGTQHYSYPLLDERWKSEVVFKSICR